MENVCQLGRLYHISVGQRNRPLQQIEELTDQLKAGPLKAGLPLEGR